MGRDVGEADIRAAQRPGGGDFSGSLSMSDAADSRYEAGLKVRTEVLGAEHVARSQARQTPLDADFQRYITETAWGGVWTRPDLDRRTRSLVTIALLAGLGRTEELELHLRASKNIGVDPREIAEVLMHVAVYAGVPAANRAFALAKTILDDPAPKPPVE
jgi:4-carboxymuconolactone decarboxylase